MYFNENEWRELVKFRKEETEMKARNAWKLQSSKQEWFLQKVVRKWKKNRKTILEQPIGGCASQC